jgi:hypothetical protein
MRAEVITPQSRSPSALVLLLLLLLLPQWQ